MKITVVMSTYNGGRYLKEQIESILNQKFTTETTLDLLVRDDGSTDDTVSILNEYKDKNLLNWYTGVNWGPAKSFMDLLLNAPLSDYYAFSDQDDVWLENKLDIAIKALDGQDRVYGLYYAIPQLVDQNLNKLPTRFRPITGNLEEIFLRTPALGCTMVINQNLRNVIVQHIPLNITMHDTYIYRFAALMEAMIVRDLRHTMLYRQHNNNVIGAKHTKSILVKIRKNYKIYKGNNAVNRLQFEYIYKNYRNILPSHSLKLLEEVLNYKKTILARLRLVFNKKFTSRNVLLNIYFRIIVLLGKY